MQNLDRRTLYSQQSITHIIFGGHNVVHMFWAQKVQNAVKKKEHNPRKNGRCGAMVNSTVGCFSNLPSDYSAFGNNALNTTQPGFPNKGYTCDSQDPPPIRIDSLRSTYYHPAKDCFPTSKS
jgi:hypothetical protein